jgi:hypothetical protein
MRKALFGWASRMLLRRDGHARASADAVDFKGEEEYVLIEDRGSDVTLFSFAGMAVLFAGMPTFEFRRLLAKQDRNYNLVFFRDVHRMAYHVSPSGGMDGLAFYEDKVRGIMERLGSTYNVALGASAGGGAAFYFGTRCGMDQIVAFSPGFPGSVYTRPLQQLQTYGNIPRLITDPTAYVEVALVTLGCVWAGRALRTHKAAGQVWNVRETYRSFREPRPRATIFYGAQCPPDRYQADRMREFPEVKLVPLPCARHNCAAYLKQRGQLGEAIFGEVEEGLGAARRVVEARA